MQVGDAMSVAVWEEGNMERTRFRASINDMIVTGLTVVLGEKNNVSTTTNILYAIIGVPAPALSLFDQGHKP